MVTGRELAFGLLGAWRLVRNDASGLQYFDRSRHGALRSFWVMLLVAPAYSVLLLMQLNYLGVAEIGLRQVLLGAGLYIVSWLMFPVVLLRLAPRLNRIQEAAGYVAAYNWTQILVMALTLFFSAVAMMMPSSVGEVLNLTLIMVVGLMQYRLLRHTMNLAPAQAGLLVVAYLCLDLALTLTFAPLLVPAKPAA